MVGPGMAYEQMITGDWIPTRQATSKPVGKVDKADLF